MGEFWCFASRNLTWTERKRYWSLRIRYYPHWLIAWAEVHVTPSHSFAIFAVVQTCFHTLPVKVNILLSCMRCNVAWVATRPWWSGMSCLKHDLLLALVASLWEYKVAWVATRPWWSGMSCLKYDLLLALVAGLWEYKLYWIQKNMEYVPERHDPHIVMICIFLRARGLRFSRTIEGLLQNIIIIKL